MSGKLSREDQAALEVGNTTVSRALSWSLSLCFCTLIFFVPVLQAVSDLQTTGSVFPSLAVFTKNPALRGSVLTGWSSVRAGNNRILENMDSFERQLEEDSVLRERLLGQGQRWLLNMGHGNEKVYSGRNHWLFYRPDMEYLWGAGFLDPDFHEKRKSGGKSWERVVQPNPVPTILAFQEYLASRGITLVLMPVPIKASLHPEQFAAGTWQTPLLNRSWNDFLRQLEQAGVPVFDVAGVLTRSRLQHPALYLRTDTHWRPEAMEETAQALAAFLEPFLPSQENLRIFKQEEESVAHPGDIESMLRLPAGQSPFEKELVHIHPVVTPGNELWQAAVDADILLLGDSFTNIYSHAGLGWGEGAGLAEQLSFFLQRPLDVIAQNDGGAHVTRELLAGELGRGRDRLVGKKIVLWQFASRELASGDWKDIPMEFRTPVASNFYIVDPGQRQRVTGTVAAVSRSPVPGSVPYKDNIISLHLVDLRDTGNGVELGQALVYGWGMRDNTLTPLARVRPGERVQLDIVDWESVQGDYASYRRSTLDDAMVELESPVWGEIIQ